MTPLNKTTPLLRNFTFSITMKQRQPDQYSPSSKTSDVNRLLDPSYSSPRSVPSTSSSAYSYAKPTVYVDHKGDLHDPDYRHFPPMNPRRQDSRRRPRSKWTPSSGYLEDHYESDANESQSDDDGKNGWHGRSLAHVSPASPRHETSRRRAARSHSPAHYNTNYYSHSSANTSPSSTTSTPLSSSPEDSAPLPKRSYSLNQTLSRRLSKPLPRSSLDYSPASGFTEESPVGDDNDDESQQLTSPAEDATDEVPNCTDSLRREWHGFALSTRIGIFRLKKKIRAAFH